MALGSAVQGASGLEAAMELAEYIGTCTSLHLRGITAEHAEPKVGPPALNHLVPYHSRHVLAISHHTSLSDCGDDIQLPRMRHVII